MGETRLWATICTNRGPDQVREPLTAIAAQAEAVDGATALLVTSGLDPRARAPLERLAKELGASVLSAGPGLAVARNRALEGAADADVIAYIDDDAMPHPDWLHRLASRWARAADDVACIGGAIEPLFGARPPVWMSERVWTSFSLLDLGTGERELSPSKGEDVWGANVSFRASPLRRVGGFDPALGLRPAVPMVGEESSAELLLERLGMRILYAGDVRVEHLVGAERLTLRSLARRELWRGVSAVLRGKRRPGSGWPRAFRAKAGLLVAVARRDWSLAGERWARVWCEWGIATAPLLKLRLRRRGWPG